VTLSPDDSRPPYLQIADDLRKAIRRGDLAPEAQLPSTAELVDRYGVARNTVRSALRLLNEEGLLVARQGSGVYVRSEIGAGSSSTRGDQLDEVTHQLAAVVQDVQRLAERVAELETLVRQIDQAH
jgi:DNA-binding GntR family transcriptional regulator